MPGLQHDDVAVPLVTLDALERPLHRVKPAFQDLREAAVAVEQRPGDAFARVVRPRCGEDLPDLFRRVALLRGNHVSAAVDKAE